ncbi:MAG: hypothetical protein R3B72_51160 [Polyangiaceae bacterium]
MPRRIPLVAALIGSLALTACGGSKNKVPEDPAPKSMADKEREVTDEDIAEATAGEPFDEEFGKRVLDRGARKAEECASMGAPTGEGKVTVIFDGEKGRVTDVELGYPYEGAGEQAQKCVKNAFIGEMIPPFDGEKRVEHTFTIPEEKKK